MSRAHFGIVLLIMGLLGCQLLVDGDSRQLGGGSSESACMDVNCKADEHCELVPVICATEPCAPVPECVPDRFPIEPFDPESPGPGDGQRPTDGSSPREDAGSTRPPSSCATVLCPPDTYCDDLGGEAQCVALPSCDGFTCEPGKHCELEEVTCVRAPCPPQPTCVSDAPQTCKGKRCPRGTWCSVVDGVAECRGLESDLCSDPCLAAKCAAGTRCEAQDVLCAKKPCCRVALCVPDLELGAPCGENTCRSGTYCCNASCGICAPKGGVCTLQICDGKF